MAKDVDLANRPSKRKGPVILKHDDAFAFNLASELVAHVLRGFAIAQIRIGRVGRMVGNNSCVLSKGQSVTYAKGYAPCDYRG